MRFRVGLPRWGCAALAMVIGMFAVLPDARADGTLDRILREKKVKVGFSLSAPMMMRDPKSGELTGFFFDAVRYIFKEVDVEPQFGEIGFANMVASVQSGEIDLSIANSFMTPKRAAAVDFTRSILFAGNMIVVRANESRFKTIEDLNQPGVKLAVLLGGSGQEFVRRTLPKADILSLNTTNAVAPFMEVASGRADAGFNDASDARRYVDMDKSVKQMLDQPYDVRPTAWIVKRGNTDLLNFVNASLDVLILSGAFREMATKYGPSGRYQPEVVLKPFP